MQLFNTLFAEGEMNTVVILDQSERAHLYNHLNNYTNIQYVSESIDFLETFSPFSCDGRVVKALDLKSNGVSPRRFESCSQRKIFFVVTEGEIYTYDPGQMVMLHRKNGDLAYFFFFFSQKR